MGVVFSVDGASQPQHISNIFQNKMLETGTGPEQWNAGLACKLNSGQNAFKTFIGAAGDNPNAVETAQFLNAGWRGNLGRFEPALLDRNANRGARMLDCFLRRLRTVARSGIANQRQ